MQHNGSYYSGYLFHDMGQQQYERRMTNSQHPHPAPAGNHGWPLIYAGSSTTVVRVDYYYPTPIAPPPPNAIYYVPAPIYIPAPIYYAPSPPLYHPTVPIYHGPLPPPLTINYPSQPVYNAPPPLPPVVFLAPPSTYYPPQLAPNHPRASHQAGFPGAHFVDQGIREVDGEKLGTRTAKNKKRKRVDPAGGKLKRAKIEMEVEARSDGTNSGVGKDGQGKENVAMPKAIVKWDGTDPGKKQQLGTLENAEGVKAEEANSEFLMNEGNLNCEAEAVSLRVTGGESEVKMEDIEGL